jgi:outer membrane receptor protein involved in Fe transport
LARGCVVLGVFMRIGTTTLISLLIAFTGLTLEAQTATPASGRIGGKIFNAAGEPVAGTVVTVQDRATGALVKTVSTDARGEFAAEELKPGAYVLAYGYAGDTAAVEVTSEKPVVDAGRLTLGEDPTVMLQKMQVSAEREAFYNSIDRKTYEVGKDIASTTGTASDLLQNIPSIQVDVEGEVSLRGDQNVTILINGRSSAQMNSNQAEALEQLSSDRIERVEVITNPSSKYRPDGTGGIINIILKDGGKPGWSATARANVGNEGRYNGSLYATYNPGAFDVFASVSQRHEERPFEVERSRVQRDAGGQTTGSSVSRTDEERSFDSTTLETGGTYRFGKETELTAAVSYGTRDRAWASTQTTVNRDGAGTVTEDYDRLRRGDEAETEYEAELAFSHGFDGGGRKLAVELGHESETEEGGDFYANRFRLPGGLEEHERTAVKETSRETELKADYVHPFANGTKLETGYALLAETSDVDFRGSFLDNATQQWVADAQTTNRFVYESQVHAAYATYAAAVGAVGLQGGLRFEQALTEADQRTAGIVREKDYARVYPSVHASYDLTATQQLKLSYSHRVRRPDQRDLNPYPQYSDPLNLRAGNPDLEPEDIHSIEAGWQYQGEGATYLASVYQRYRYDGITEVTRDLGNGVLLTTNDNLATSRFTGVELGATAKPWPGLSLNFGGNIYREEIDAENLGFAGTRAEIAWDAKLNTAWEVNRKLSLQLTSGYRAARLTPQGERRPMAISNLGARYAMTNRTAFVLTVSDVFGTFKGRTVLDTASLSSDTTMRRGSSVVYLGVVHQFGGDAKRRGEEMQFDEGMGGE